MNALPQAVARASLSSSASDAKLLARYRRSADERAFAELVRRHQRAVVAACRQVLGPAADVDDAVQATFLTLVRHAGRVRPDHGLGGWLFAVAHRVAVRAARTAARRTRHESAVPPARPVASPPAELLWREAAAALHAELDRLADRHRLPLLLCYLDGLSRDEAAARLGWKAGSVKAGLERGREKLRAALARRGITLTAGLLAVLAADATAGRVPPRLLESILAAAGGAPSPAAAALAHGAAMTPLPRTALAVGLAAVLAAAGFGWAALPPTAARDDKPAMKAEPKDGGKPAKPEKPAALAGTVTGPDGKPADGATIYLGYYPNGWLATSGDRVTAVKAATTDKDGKFRTDVPKDAPAGFWVYAMKPGCGAAWVEPNYPKPVIDTAEALALRLTKDVPVRGTVVTTEGKPVAGASVGVLDVIEPKDADLDRLLKGAADGRFGTVGQWEKVLWLPKEVASATTDKDGKFEIAGLGADRVVGLTVSGKGLARMTGFAVTRPGVDVAPLNRRPDGSLDKQKGRHPVFYGPNPAFVVEPGYAVQGTVTAKATGKPVPGCQVEVDTGFWDRVVAVTDKDGKYRVDGVSKGAFHHANVHAPADAAVFSTWAEVRDPDGYAAVTLDFALAPGAVFRGRVIDKQTHKPVAAAFQIVPHADNPFAKKPEYETASRDMVWKGGENADGTFRIVTLPGRSAANISAPPTDTLNGQQFSLYRAGQSVALDLKEGDNAEVVVELDRGATAAVAVVDADGKPLSGLATTGQTVNNYLGGGVQHLAFKLADDESAFTVYGLGEGEKRRVAVIHPAKKLAAVVTATAGGKHQVKLVPLQPFRCTFHLADGTPLAGVTVQLDYDLSVGEHAPGWTTTATTDKDGQFEIPDVIPGLPFTLNATKGEVSYRGAPRIGTQTVPAGKPLDLGVRTVEEVRE